MPTLISDIASWVTGDVLNRTDLTSIAQNAAIQFYRLMCAKVPFDQLMALSAELPLTATIADYDLSILVPPLLSIQNIRLTRPDGTHRRFRRTHPRVYDALSVVMNGIPATYARFGYIISINPPPDAGGYTMRVRYWTRPTEAIPVQNTQLVTPIEWDELVRWETLYRVLNHIGEYEKASMLIVPQVLPRQPSPKRQQMFEVGIIPRLWNELLSTISQKENVDEDFSINPVVRAYSYR